MSVRTSWRPSIQSLPLDGAAVGDSSDAEHDQVSVRPGGEDAVDLAPEVGVAQVIAHEEESFAIEILNGELGAAGAVHVLRLCRIRKIRKLVLGSTGTNWRMPASEMPGPSKLMRNDCELEWASLGSRARETPVTGWCIQSKPPLRTCMLKSPLIEQIFRGRLVGGQSGQVGGLLPDRRVPGELPGARSNNACSRRGSGRSRGCCAEKHFVPDFGGCGGLIF